MSEQRGQVGGQVRFWLPQTGLKAQKGKISALFETQEGIPYAEIIPEKQPEERVYLCYRAVWGYDLEQGGCDD